MSYNKEVKREPRRKIPSPSLLQKVTEGKEACNEGIVALSTKTKANAKCAH